MSVTPVARIARPYLGVVAVITATTAFGFARLLAQQGDWPPVDGRPAFVLTFVVALAIVALIGTFARTGAVRAAAAAACAGGLLPLGFFALFSIGLVLLAAGVLSLVAWRAAMAAETRHSMLSAGSALLAIVVLATGFAATG